MIEKIRSYYESNPGKFTLVALLILTFIFRLSWADMFSTNSDPTRILESANWLLWDFEDYSLRHRSFRFGVIIPVYLFRLLLGTNPYGFIFIVLIVNCLQAFFLYRIAQNLFNSNIAFYTVAFFLFSPLLFIPGYSYNMQLFPGPFEMLYTLGCFYFLTKDKEAPDVKNVIIAAFFMFLAFESKMNDLYFAPAVMVILIKWPRKFFLFSGVLGLLLGIELLIYNIFTPYYLGKISVIKKTHFANLNNSLVYLDSFIDLLGRFTYGLKLVYKVFFYPFFILSGYLFYRWIKDRERNIAIILSICYSFLFLITISIKNINPIQVALPFNNRYLTVVIPFVGLVIVVGIFRLIENMKGKKFHEFVPLRKISFLALTIMISSAGFIIYKGSSLPLISIHKYDVIIDGAVKNNLPIVAHPGGSQIKAIDVAIHNFVDDSEIISSDLIRYTSLKNKNVYYYHYSEKAKLDDSIPFDENRKVVVVTSTPFRVIETTLGKYLKGKYSFPR